MQYQSTEAMETFIGHIKTPQDALLIFEACRRGQLQRVKRRLSTKERMNIRSGSIFAFDENESGMRRWTDGRTWSPSRVLGSFLTYRELDTKRRPRRSSTHSSSRGDSHVSCSYKQNGLIKQSFSICTASNQKIHLISYYAKSDVVHGRLTFPSMDPILSKIIIPKGLYPELNPLDTSGGHSATLHLMMKATYDEQQNNQHRDNENSNSCVTSTSSYGNNITNYYGNYGNKKDAIHGQPPSLSSSPVSLCSDDDFLSSSQASQTRSPLPSPTINKNFTSATTLSVLSPPTQVWKPYSLQSEDTRQLDALKTRLRI